MSLNEYLHKVLKDDVLEDVSQSDASVILRGPDAKMSVQVTGIPPSTTVLRMGRVNHLSCLKYGRSMQICDYLLVANMDSKIYAIFIELKRTLTEEDKPKEQLRRSLPILDYLLSVCKVEFGSVPKVLTKYVIIAEKNKERLDKQPTRVTPSQPVSKENHKAIEIMKFIMPKISIMKLAGG